MPLRSAGNELARAELIAAGELPSPIYMTCSGKHSAMLATCVVNDWPLETYMEPTHPLQLAIQETIFDLSGEEEQELGIDGCGLPIVPALAHEPGAGIRTPALS